MFQTNVTGLIAMTQAILPIFLARPDGGRGDIINIGSIAGREPYAGGSIYCATKAAVRSFTDALRKELIASRVRVMEIDPGQVETEFSVVRFGGDREKAKKVYEGVEPLTGDDIAEVVVFAAARRENVVLADTLVFPNHQVCVGCRVGGVGLLIRDGRRLRRFCIGSRHRWIGDLDRCRRKKSIDGSRTAVLVHIRPRSFLVIDSVLLMKTSLLVLTYIKVYPLTRSSTATLNPTEPSAKT
jgi:hypothetical protein